jgi:hypothetical protein
VQGHLYENVETASPNRTIRSVAATQILERQDAVITRISRAALLEAANGLLVCYGAGIVRSALGLRELPDFICFSEFLPILWATKLVRAPSFKHSPAAWIR